jgi:sugar phosphate isomerase/epimerase
MYLTGFADEAAETIEGQIKATKTLKWRFIESRNINGKNIHDISDEEFDHVVNSLEEQGIRINCFGSAIANWSKQITEPFDSSLEEAKRAIPRMQRLGCKLIRIMSFAVLKDRGPDDQMEAERIKRLNILVPMFLDVGIQPVHENCMNYGGMGWTFTLRLIEQVPGIKLVFDTGNPVMTDDFTKNPPYPKQSAWEFYNHVKEHIAYVHIKDGKILAPTDQNTFPKTQFTFAGDGDGDVKRIVADLVENGYDGGFSMEPHLSVVFHEKDDRSESEIRFNNYVEYGKRFMLLLEDIGVDTTMLTMD